MAEPKTKTYYALKVTRDNGDTFTLKPDSDGELYAGVDRNGGYVRATRVPQDLANAKAAAEYRREKFGHRSVELVVRTRTTVDEPVVEEVPSRLPTTPGSIVRSAHIDPDGETFVLSERAGFGQPSTGWLRVEQNVRIDSTSASRLEESTSLRVLFDAGA